MGRACEPLAKELAVEPFPRTVPGEHPAGAIRAVRSRREPDDEEPGFGIAEAGYRPSPVLLVPILFPFLSRIFRAVYSEPRASLARDHVAGNEREARAVSRHKAISAAYNAKLLPDRTPRFHGGSVTQRSILFSAIAAAVLSFAASPRAGAELTPGTPAPGFAGNHAWFNSRPLSLKNELKGKVVLVDVWEYTCINCIRTLPALKRIYSRYHPLGFEIIGVHAPEFDFAYKPENVALGTKRQRIPWPVVVDSDFSIWHAYDNNSWPNKFLINAQGIIVRQHSGEGGYAELERLIREEIRKANPKTTFPAGWDIPPDTNDFDPMRCGATSEETYVGTARGARWDGEIANAEGFQPGKTVLYSSLPHTVRRGFHAHGLWKNN